jgi:hypothetical protein
MRQTFFKHDMVTRVDDALDRQQQDAAEERLFNKLIDARDGRRCRACGKATDCDSIALLRGHRAHIVYASAGGPMDPFNRVTLCPKDHSDEHKDTLRFTEEGGPYVGVNANEPMEFWRRGDDGRWYLSRREVSVGVPERD